MTRQSSPRRSTEATFTRAFNKLVAAHPVWAAVVLVVLTVGAWLLLRDGATDTQPRGARTRGALRIVTGSNGEVYWTDDHYASFMIVGEDP